MRIARAWWLTIPHCVGSCRKSPKSSPHIAIARFINVCLFGLATFGSRRLRPRLLAAYHSLPLVVLLTWVERFTLSILFSFRPKWSLTAICLVSFLVSKVKPNGWPDVGHWLTTDGPRTGFRETTPGTLAPRGSNLTQRV